MSASPCGDKQALVNEDQLLRRAPFKDPRYVKPDQTLSSASFTPRWKRGEKDLSVDVERLTSNERSIHDQERYRLYRLSVAFVRSLKLCVCHDPCPAEEPLNTAHALIRSCHDVDRAACPGEEGVSPGVEHPQKITESLSRLMARHAVQVGYPEGV